MEAFPVDGSERTRCDSGSEDQDFGSHLPDPEIHDEDYDDLFDAACYLDAVREFLDRTAPWLGRRCGLGPGPREQALGPLLRDLAVLVPCLAISASFVAAHTQGWDYDTVDEEFDLVPWPVHETLTLVSEAAMVANDTRRLLRGRSTPAALEARRAAVAVARLCREAVDELDMCMGL
jgi:hypothetical protein